MSKDLKKLAKKYNTLSTSEKIAVEGAVRGEIMDVCSPIGRRQ